MSHSLFIFLGAGFGGVLRYWTSNGIHLLFGRNYPYGTLAVNVSGCFLMGLFTALLLEHFDGTSPQLRALLLIGFLGGYTTFSAFSIETLNLFESGHGLSAIINILSNTMMCLMAVWIGVIGGRSL